MAVAVVAAVVGVAGCESSGVFDGTAFHSRVYPYTIRYADPEEHALLSSDWVVENYYADATGKPTTSKRRGEYRKLRDIELTSGSTTEQYVDVYDVMLEHRASDAVIWMRSIPMSPRQPRLDLRVVAGEYAERLSGSGFFATDLGRARVESQTYASRLMSGRPVVVAGLEGYEATIEVANVDQLKLDPSSRVAMVRVVFVHTPFTSPTRSDSDKLPIMWMIGYANNPTDFEAQAPDFTRFLGLIDTNGSHGFTVLPPVPSTAIPASSAPAPSAVPSAPAAPPTSAAPAQPASRADEHPF